MTEFWPWVPILTAAFTYLTWRRLLAYLRYFQQEGYEHLRFLRWTSVRSLTDPAFWVALASAFLFLADPLLAVVLFTTGMVVLGLVQPDPRESGKIPLRLTWRARRVLVVALVLSLSAFVLLVRLFMDLEVRAPLVAASFMYALLPLVLIAANLILAPYEGAAQRSYYADAVAQLARVHPFVVGITGSYGKSSTKSMLAHMLQFHAPTLAATGSINTLMGVTRHIREELVPGHRFMVVEMGAYSDRLHRAAVRADAAVGGDHHRGRRHAPRALRTTDAIYQAKSELAQAVPPGGLLVVQCRQPDALRIAQASTHCRVLLYGEHRYRRRSTRASSTSASRRRAATFVLQTARPCLPVLHAAAWAARSS